MIDIELIREKPDFVVESFKRRGKEVPLLEIIDLDQRRRTAISEMDSLRARRNAVSKEIGSSKEKPPELIAEMRRVGAQIKDLEEEETDVSDRLNQIMLDVPNIPSESSPDGADENANVVGSSIGETLGIIDYQRGVKLAQSRFYLLKGKGARLQRALISWMLDLHTEKHGYRELYLPYLVNRDTVTASSHLPHFEENMYHDKEDDLFMVPTAEAPVTGMFRDEILDGETLPLKFVSHTPCWRREKFSAGRDTRGIKRVNQFDKVEMYKFVEPDSSFEELELLLKDAERVCVELNIPHRVLELCTGDLGFAAAKSYDVEMWGAGTQEWLEVSSCSNCTDFQSRRAAIRYRDSKEARPKLLHNLNGSGLAVPRVMIAILENYQTSDGSIEVPEVLKSYAGFSRISSE